MDLIAVSASSMTSIVTTVLVTWTIPNMKPVRKILFFYSGCALMFSLDCLPLKIGDGICHDECNNYEFFDDMGDCCMAYIDDSKCSKCLCDWDQTRHLSQNAFQCTKERVGDGVCNDNCNTAEFQYDDYDCCSIFIWSEQCIDCSCHLSGVRHPDFLCSAHRAGNFRCEDACNFYHYDYDGLDCCSEIINSDYCDICTCHLTGLQHPDM